MGSISYVCVSPSVWLRVWQRGRGGGGTLLRRPAKSLGRCALHASGALGDISLDVRGPHQNTPNLTLYQPSILGHTVAGERHAVPLQAPQPHGAVARLDGAAQNTQHTSSALATHPAPAGSASRSADLEIDLQHAWRAMQGRRHCGPCHDNLDHMNVHCNPHTRTPLLNAPAVPFTEVAAGPELSPAAVLLPLAAAGLGVVGLRFAFYSQLEYITASMITRYVPKGGCSVPRGWADGGTLPGPRPQLAQTHGVTR